MNNLHKSSRFSGWGEQPFYLAVAMRRRTRSLCGASRAGLPGNLTAFSRVIPGTSANSRFTGEGTGPKSCKSCSSCRCTPEPKKIQVNQACSSLIKVNQGFLKHFFYAKSGDYDFEWERLSLVRYQLPILLAPRINLPSTLTRPTCGKAV
jgi:hypothetical protein